MHIDIGTTRRAEVEFDEEHPNPDAPKEAEHVDKAETLYFFENLSVPRLEERFETPLGYWSTDPDDWPSGQEMADQFTMREKRGIVSLGFTCRDKSVMWRR